MCHNFVGLCLAQQQSTECQTVKSSKSHPPSLLFYIVLVRPARLAFPVRLVRHLTSPRLLSRGATRLWHNLRRGSVGDATKPEDKVKDKRQSYGEAMSWSYRNLANDFMPKKSSVLLTLCSFVLISHRLRLTRRRYRVSPRDLRRYGRHRPPSALWPGGSPM